MKILLCLHEKVVIIHHFAFSPPLQWIFCLKIFFNFFSAKLIGKWAAMQTNWLLQAISGVLAFQMINVLLIIPFCWIHSIFQNGSDLKYNWGFFYLDFTCRKILLLWFEDFSRSHNHEIYARDSNNNDRGDREDKKNLSLEWRLKNSSPFLFDKSDGNKNFTRTWECFEIAYDFNLIFCKIYHRIKSRGL